jgi:hypothetical protein
MVTLNATKAEKVDRSSLCCLPIGSIVKAVVDKVKSVVQALLQELELTKQDFKMTFKRDEMFVCLEDGSIHEIDLFVCQKRSELFPHLGNGSPVLSPLAPPVSIELEDMVL